MRSQRTTLPALCARCSKPLPTGRHCFCSRSCREARDSIQFTTDGSAAMIPLRSADGSVKAYAYVDVVDADRINQRRWSLKDDGYAFTVATVNGRKTSIKMHREVLSLVTGDGIEVDHIDGDRLNNRRGNLREATRLENAQNIPAQPNRTSRYRGVSFNRARGKWHARIVVNNRRHHLGFFATELEAAEAARSARLRLMPYTVESRSEAAS